MVTFDVFDFEVWNNELSSDNYFDFSVASDVYKQSNFRNVKQRFPFSLKLKINLEKKCCDLCVNIKR